MNIVYKVFVRPILFLFPPESIHNFIAGILRFLSNLGILRFVAWLGRKYDHPSLEREVFGLRFRNPVGLAAGFDKDAIMVDALGDLGFGFVEIGTITPVSQAGNPKPRLFRLIKDKALINRMGFNNEGVDKAVSRLKKRRSKIIVGGNIGKNKITPNEDAVKDYVIALNALYNVVDYFAVNISSPNTPGLRDLQSKEPLTKLLSTLKEEINKKPVTKPILLKIAPDLSDRQLKDIVDIVNRVGMDGIIATNTTISRTGLKTRDQEVRSIGEGGLSGKPLTGRSTEIIRFLNKYLREEIPIIGVGGIMNEDDALEKLEAGASLIQLYTGFIYEGPAIINKIRKTLINRNYD